MSEADQEIYQMLGTLGEEAKGVAILYLVLRFGPIWAMAAIFVFMAWKFLKHL